MEQTRSLGSRYSNLSDSLSEQISSELVRIPRCLLVPPYLNFDSSYTNSDTETPPLFGYRDPSVYMYFILSIFELLDFFDHFFS